MTTKSVGRVDGTVGGAAGTPQRRSLSVSQLQGALRAAHHCDVEPGADSPEVDTAIGEGVAADRQSREVLERMSNSSEPRRAGFAAVLSKATGLQDLGALLAARRSRRSPRSEAAASKAVAGWDVPSQSRTASLFAHARRWLVVAVAVMLLLVGGVTVAGRVLAIVDPAPVVVAALSRVSDVQFAGTAQAAVVDYLTWDATTPRAVRAAALIRWGPSAAMNDGWDGSGALVAENTSAIGVLRTADDRAVVTVQARISSSPAVPQPMEPVTNSPERTPSATHSMWLTVSVPVALSAGRIVVTAPPVIVGSPPTQAPAVAVSSAADEDTEGGRTTADTVGKLVAAFGSGDLEFVRGPDSEFTGLAGMVTSGVVQSWRMAKVPPGGDPTLRVGDVTVLWALPGGAGGLRSSYRVELALRENRWLLQQITPAMEAR